MHDSQSPKLLAMHVKQVFFLLAFSLIRSGFLWAQAPNIDLFRSNPPIEIKQYGEDVMRHLIRGDNQMILGNFNEALLAYDNAIVQSPYWAEAFLKRAIAKERMGMRSEANEDYQRALRLNPYVADLYGYPSQQRRRSMLNFPVERYLLTANEETEAALAKAATASALQVSRLNHAANLVLSDRIPEAISIYNNLLQFQHDLVPALYRSRSIAYFLNGDLERARADVERWYESSRDNPEFYFLLMGNIYFLYGEFDNAIDYFSEVIRINADHETAYYHRGLALLLFYNRADACYDLERSAALGLDRGAIKQQYFCNY